MNSSTAKQKIILIVSLAIILLLGLFISIFRDTPYFQIISSPFTLLLKTALTVSIHTLDLFGVPIEVDKLTIIHPFELQGFVFEPRFLMRKWLLALLLCISFTPKITLRQRILSVIIFLVYFFVVVSIKLTLIALCLKGGYNAEDAHSIAISIAILLLILPLFMWIRLNPSIIDWLAQQTKTRQEYLQRKIVALFYLLIGLQVLGFLLSFFTFEPWINLIFTATHYILNLLGHTSEVQPFFLLGPNMNIYMAKGCLGLKTAYLFGAFIYLSGESLKPKLIYLSLGIVIINIANVFRFVFLFIHIQKHGEYLWKIELHDLYNLLIYALTFGLWVIWLNWYTDIWLHLKENPTADTFIENHEDSSSGE